jgi:DNA-binding CsgD family transcriptional regulator
MHRSWLLEDLLRLGAAEPRLVEEAQGLRRRLGMPARPVPPAPAPGATPTRPAAPPAGIATSPADADRGRFGLSDRERDVVTLVSIGMSYQQIAQELFITRSTVGFHLGKVYAKAGVTSRHELIALLRSDPSAFGLAASLG